MESWTLYALVNVSLSCLKFFFMYNYIKLI